MIVAAAIHAMSNVNDAGKRCWHIHIIDRAGELIEALEYRSRVAADLALNARLIVHAVGREVKVHIDESYIRRSTGHSDVLRFNAELARPEQVDKRMVGAVIVRQR